MKVTICIPSFTTNEAFQTTYQSILEQDYTDWTILITVNNKNKYALSSESLKNTTILWQPENTTFSQTLCALNQAAESDWIAYCECGDRWHPKKLGYQVHTFNMLRSKQEHLNVFATNWFQKGTQPQIPKTEGVLCEKDFEATMKLHLSSLLLHKPSIQIETRPQYQDCVLYATLYQSLLRGSLIYLSGQPLVEVLQPPEQPGASAKELWALYTSPDTSIEEATVVTAFYEMPNKWTNNHYKTWLKAFFTNVACNLVVFTDETTAELFRSWRSKYQDKTRIIVLPREEWTANRKWGANLWEQQKAKDPETKSHSPDLYKIWYEKKEFVLKTIQWNPFHTTKFVWCDAGLVRSHETLGWMTQFARADRIPDEKMLLLQIDPFEEEDKVPQQDGIPGNFLRKNRIGGGIQAATAEVWISWSKRYDAMMQRYINAGRFIGKDQSIMASMILEDPNAVFCVNPPPGRYRDPLQIWFYLALWLGANELRFKMI